LGGKVGDAVQSMASGLGGTAAKLASDFASKLTSGIVTQRIRMEIYNKGKLDFASIAADAFGNALGDGIVAEMTSDRNSSNANYRNEMDRESDSYTPASAYSYRNGMDLESDGVVADRERRDALYGLTDQGFAHGAPRGGRNAVFIPGVDDGEFIDVGGATMRQTPRLGTTPRYRVTQQFELALNNRNNALLETLGEAAQLGDYQRASNSDFDLIDEWVRHNKRGAVIDQIRQDIGQSGRVLPELGTTRLPSLKDPMFSIEVPNYGADELAKHLEYGRRWALAKQGAITLGADFSIETIGKNRLTPTQFAEQLQGVYERSVAAAAPEADSRAAAGRLFVNYIKFGEAAESIAKGNFVDLAGKRAVNDWLGAQGVTEGPFGLVSVGRRFSDLGDPLKYRMPDVLVRFGPGDIFALDATLGTKTATTGQVRDTLNYGAGRWGNVTPSGTQWISNTNVVPLLPRKR
jgi:hypothetical protein